MLNILKHYYHKYCNHIWFYRQLNANVQKIRTNSKLSNQEKGDLIYHKVFWQTWHQCYEPSLAHDDLSILNVLTYFRDTLAQLHYQYPKADAKILNDFKNYTKEHPYHMQPLGAGCLVEPIEHVDLTIQVWHFGDTPNLSKCEQKAFAEN